MSVLETPESRMRDVINGWLRLEDPNKWQLKEIENCRSIDLNNFDEEAWIAIRPALKHCLTGHCFGCEAQPRVLVCFEADDIDSHDVHLCRSCLAKALSLFEEIPGSPK